MKLCVVSPHKTSTPSFPFPSLVSLRQFNNVNVYVTIQNKQFHRLIDVTLKTFFFTATARSWD